MSKFNKSKVQSPGLTSPIKTESVASGKTYEGAAGFGHDTKSELFLLAVANFVGEDTFYEGKTERDERYRGLVHQVARDDVDWLIRFVSWLRNDANMRSAPVVAAAEGVWARLQADQRGRNRELVRAAIRRADEPGEFIAYWISRFGRGGQTKDGVQPAPRLPMPVKRGLGDKIIELGTEFNYLKWGTSEARGFKFADILNLTHAGDHKGSRQQIRGQWQHDLFGHAVKVPYSADAMMDQESLGMLTARAMLMAMPVDERRAVLESPEVLKQAGMTWESLAGWLQGPMDAKAWEAMIPSMGYMALLGNLRNFDTAGVSDTVAQQVAARLSDPVQVAKSRQFPMRFLSAHRAAPSLRWSYPLEQALGYAVSNIPQLRGRTLILVDTSSSMRAGFSKDGTLRRWDAAAIFGIALGARAEQADVVSYSGAGWLRDHTASKEFPLIAGESLLRSLNRWDNGGFFISGGTETAGAVRRHFRKHDRIVVLTDEQAYFHGGTDVFDVVPAMVPCYTWNLAGYQMGHAPSGTAYRHTFSGLSDSAFRMIDLLERGNDTDWPF